MVTHHSPENQVVVADADQRSSAGLVGGTPTPRNESVASVMIAVAM